MQEISKRVGEIWQKLGGEERAPYIDKAKEDKERCEAALQGYAQAHAQASQAVRELQYLQVRPYSKATHSGLNLQPSRWVRALQGQEVAS